MFGISLPSSGPTTFFCFSFAFSTSNLFGSYVFPVLSICVVSELSSSSTPPLPALTPAQSLPLLFSETVLLPLPPGAQSTLQPPTSWSHPRRPGVQTRPGWSPVEPVLRLLDTILRAVTRIFFFFLQILQICLSWQSSPATRSLFAGSRVYLARATMIFEKETRS